MAQETLGKVVLDVDVDAERYVLMDRYTCSVFHNGRTDTNVRYVPLKYTEAANLLAFIIDDDRQFNAVCADGITAELVAMKDVT